MLAVAVSTLATAKVYQSVEERVEQRFSAASKIILISGQPLRYVHQTFSGTR
jgi:hypothetical protein